MKSNAQIISVIIAIVLGVIGIAVFASMRSSTGANAKIQLAVWGIVDRSVIDRLIQDDELLLQKRYNISYTFVPEEEFDRELTGAIAEGRGPDVVLMTESHVLTHRKKLYPIPYENYSERLFRDTFVEVGEPLMLPEGIIAFPLAVDPLVLYWNRTLLSNSGIVRPPAFWDELPDIVEKITVADDARNISLSGIALGEYTNVTNAKDILSALILQSGNSIIQFYENVPRSTLEDSVGGASIPQTEAVLRFYTEFSNPVKDVYTWNKSLPDSLSLFVAGDLALYIGHAGEIDDIRLKNPNLNFDVAVLPQIRDAGVRATEGHVYVLGVPKSSKNVSGAFKLVYEAFDKDFSSKFANLLFLAPTRRDALVEEPLDPYMQVFFDSSLISQTWLDPDTNASDTIFSDMVNSVTSGRFKLSETVRRASTQLDALLK